MSWPLPTWLDPLRVSGPDELLQVLLVGMTIGMMRNVVEQGTGSSARLEGVDGAGYEDIKAMAPEDFAKGIMRPFLSQLSINAYESTYGMEGPDSIVYRRALLEDLLDTSTLVDHER